MYISLKPSRFHTHPFGSTCQADRLIMIGNSQSGKNKRSGGKQVCVELWRRVELCRVP